MGIYMYGIYVSIGIYVSVYIYIGIYECRWYWGIGVGL